MTVIPQSHLDVLQSTALAYVATLGPQGAPQVSAVWFGWDGAQLMFSMSKGRQKYRNLLRDRPVAVAIADPADPYRSLEIRGEARIFVMTASLGLIAPQATTLALAGTSPQIAGSASAVLGVVQFSIGAGVAPLIGLGGSTTALPLAGAIAAFGIAALVTVVVFCRPASA